LKLQRAYNMIEQMISQGFCILGVSFADQEIILKTLNEKEYKNARLLSGKNILKHTAAKMAYATYYIQGKNVLADRHNHIEDLFHFYLHLEESFLSELDQAYDTLEQKSSEALECLEGYCYSSSSRNIWRATSSTNILSEENTGIKGTSSLGINSVQQYWININKNLDIEEQQSHRWDTSIFVASASNPEGVKKISGSMDQSKKMLEEHRRELIKYGNEKRRRVVKAKKDKSRWSSDIKTSEDLVLELNKQMEGKEDRHDEFMRKWYAKNLRIEEENKKKLEQAKQESKMRREEVQLEEQSRTVSQEEIEDHISGKKSLNPFTDKKPNTKKADYVHNSHRIIESIRR
jgi:hypothetical protein